jgi:hypothetical protein
LGFVGEFFSGLVDAVVALWEFSGGIKAVLVTGVSIALGVGLTLGALRLRDRSGWLSSILGMMAASIALWWLFGILPSAWVYFADGERVNLAGRVIPDALPFMANFYQVFRDLVVIGETTVAILAFALAASFIQKRYPRALAEGEEARPQSGGYK